METKMDDIDRLAPDRLMRMFSRSPIILAWILSVVIHFALGAATSWDDMWALIRGQKTSWEKKLAGETGEVAGPTGTVTSATGTVTSATGTVASATGTVTTVAAPTNVPAVGTNVTAVSTNEIIEGTASYEAAMLKKYSNSAVVKDITAVDTNIPKGPTDDLNISIKDTDPFHK